MSSAAALRLVRAKAPLVRQSASRSLATTAGTFNAGAAAPATSSPSATVIPLSNVEAQWARLNTEQRLAVHEQLEVLQKKDWKELSMEEKRAGMQHNVLCYIRVFFSTFRLQHTTLPSAHMAPVHPLAHLARPSRSCLVSSVSYPLPVSFSARFVRWVRSYYSYSSRNWLTRVNSSSPSPNNQQGVGRGCQRVRKEAELGSYQWYVSCTRCCGGPDPETE